MASNLASINILFRVDTRSLSTGLQNSIRTMNQYGTAMQDVGRGMSAYVTAPLLAAAVASGKFASDFNESSNKVDVAFGNAKGSVEAFANSSLTSFGIAKGSALDMAALFGDMATSMGLPQSEAAKLSTSLVGLAGDLASFKNISLDQAKTALNGIFTGETESLKMLGIVMTEANLAQFALSQGMTKNLKDFTQAEKVQLRYAYVMKQTTNAQGDFMRTGGGAANQTRVLQEGLKELGVQFGQVILPVFTSAVHGINDLVAGLKDMDEGTRNTVVGVAAVAAGIGPLVFGLGSAVKGVASFRAELTLLKTALVSNPFTAVAVGLTALAVTGAVVTSRFTAMTDSGKEFAEVMKSGSDNIARETAELNKNIAIAKNEKQSKEARLQAIENLNAINPEYQNGLTLENINTEKATAATEKYTESLLKKARVMAAQEKLVDVQRKLLDLQLAQYDAVKPSLVQNFANIAASMGNVNRLATLTTGTMKVNLKEETAALEDLQKKLTDFIGANEDLTAAQAAGTVTATGAQAKTIDFYNAQISVLEKLRTGAAVTAGQVAAFDEKILALREKINALEGKRIEVVSVLKEVDERNIKSPVEFSYGENNDRIKQLQKERDAFLAVQKEFDEGTTQFEGLQKRINDLNFAIQFNIDPASLIAAVPIISTAVDEMNVKQEELKKKQQELLQTAQMVGDGVANAFDGMSDRFVDSLGGANDGFQGFTKTMASTVLKLVSMMLASSISQSIAGATAAGTATGPAAIVTTPAFIATAVSGVIAAFAAIPKFETGGVVGGSSYYGDKILTRLNSRELVLNTKQQEKIYKSMDNGGGSNVNVTVGGSFEIDGTKLRLLLDRTDSRKNRIG